MEKLPKRKGNRLSGYDYSQAGMYFVTVCTKVKRNPLGEVVGAATRCPGCRPHVVLSEYGKIVDIAISNIPMIYESVKVNHYVIMPNHIHMLIQIEKSGRQIAAPTVSLIIGNMKRAVSIKLKQSIWQKSYYDHIILSEKEYEKIAHYIDENPQTWANDRYYSTN